MKNKRDVLKAMETETKPKVGKNKKEIKPISPAAAALLIILAFGVMAVFVAYLVLPEAMPDSGEGSVNESIRDFSDEESLEPPPEVGEVRDKMSDADVGDIVTFGNYEQNGKSEDGNEPIEWIVLDKNENSLLLISRFCLDCVPYNTAGLDSSWYAGSLRAWLDEDFADSAFTDKESESIISIARSESMESSFMWEDKVSLLDTEQAKLYFEYDSWRIAQPTEYAVSRGARIDENGNCWWWLIGKGDLGDGYAPYVHFNGIVGTGFAVDFDEVAVRPVICVSSEAETDVNS